MLRKFYPTLKACNDPVMPPAKQFQSRVNFTAHATPAERGTNQCVKTATLMRPVLQPHEGQTEAASIP